MTIQQACFHLGITPNDPDLKATAKKAFRRLVKELHPDKSKTDTSDRFNLVTESYEFINKYIEHPTNLGPHHFVQPGFHINTAGFTVNVAPGQTVQQSVDANGNVHIRISFE